MIDIGSNYRSALGAKLDFDQDAPVAPVPETTKRENKGKAPSRRETTKSTPCTQSTQCVQGVRSVRGTQSVHRTQGVRGVQGVQRLERNIPKTYRVPREIVDKIDLIAYWRRKPVQDIVTEALSKFISRAKDSELTPKP